ncbi:MAG: tetratricopeptide repeat protein, partial [Candidatus Thorarchaeota archaeon]
GNAILLAEIVQTAPNVRILVTSREKLNLRGEVSFPLHGMRFPEEEEFRLTDMPFTAIELFLQLTKRTNPDFVPSDEDLKMIGRICRLVEGMPLGVELATGWMETLSPSEIASEIKKSFDFLEAEKQDIPERHQSLRAVFDYTWKLLSNDEQRVLKKISVFRGGCTTEAARDVAGASFKQIQRLVNKSLLQRSARGRFDLHGILRQYTAEMLEAEEEERVRNKHCDYYTDFLHDNTLDLIGGHLKEALTEIDNIRACCRWAISQMKHDTFRKFSHSVLFMYHAQGLYEEARTIFGQAYEALRLAGHKDPHSAIVRNNMGWFQIMTGNYEKGITNLRAGHAIIHESGNKKEMATANSMLFLMDRSLTDTEKNNLMEENLTFSEEIAEPQIRIEAKAYMASLATDIDEWEKAENLYHEVLRVSKASNHLRFISLSYRGLGNIAFQNGEYSKSKSFYEESLSYAKEMGFKMFISIALDRLSDVALARKEYEEAEKRIRDSLEIAKFSGDLLREANSQRRLGVVAHEKGDYSESDKHYLEALKIFRRIDEQKRIGYITCELGNNAVATGNYKEALDYYLDAFESGLQLAENGEWVVTYCIACLAILQAQRDVNLEAVEFATLASDHPKLNTYMQSKMTKLLTHLQGELSSEDFAEAQERGRERDVLSTGKEIIDLLEREYLVSNNGT